ncbi:hypothetical protein LSCM1_01809 [Leishmania martiniquensis]|uniref:Integral membrane bound transporter domain-containing protein n=1 Tax=Leishmania martiniquensis TaxID=1580590 RepID=A0A836GRN4_9TRYP|nr:hypothetical protein LSCM1_01809 [Leishmania martiniquensis]
MQNTNSATPPERPAHRETCLHTITSPGVGKDERNCVDDHLRFPYVDSNTPVASQCATGPAGDLVDRSQVAQLLDPASTQSGRSSPPPLRAGVSSVGLADASGSGPGRCPAELRSGRYQDGSERIDATFVGAAEPPLNTSDTYAPITPMRQHSIIVTEGKRYRPVANDLIWSHSSHPFSHVYPTTPGSAPALVEGRSLAAPRTGPRSHSGRSHGLMVEVPGGRNEGLLRGNAEIMEPLDENDPINSFAFFVGGSDSEELSSWPKSDSPPPPTARAASSHTRLGHSRPSSQDSIFSERSGKEAGGAATECHAHQLFAEMSANVVPALRRTSPMQLHEQSSFLTGGDGSQDRMSHPDGLRSRLAGRAAPAVTNGGISSSSISEQEEKAAENYRRMPMHEALPCLSRENLEDDTVSFKAVWESLKSEALSGNTFYSLRVTAFAVLPSFLLMQHPKTKDWFVAGSLFPIIAGLFVRPSLGATMLMAVVAFHTVAAFLAWGIIMNAVGAKHNVPGWWCGVIFGCALFSLFGNLPAKRLMMMFAIIIMQMEHSPGGETLTFVVQFALNFIIAAGFSLLASLLPYPTLACRKADEGLLGLHKLYSAGVGNAMKSFWAPVSMDAKMALTQIPFAKIHQATTKVNMEINFATYEPLELNLNNTLRRERLVMLQRIKMHLYAMSAASANRLQHTNWLHRSQIRRDIDEVEKRVQTPAMDLAGELMRLLVQIGGCIDPNTVVARVNFDEMMEKTQTLSDIIEQEQVKLLVLRDLSVDEMNYCLGLLGFHFSLIDIAVELQRFERAMKTFDSSLYPSIWRRAFNFFFYDRWNDFWEELPKRFTLSTPYDIRLLKDTIRYTGAFAVACAFTLNYDHKNVYYFGMTILIRLAQQTASETLAVGIHRICGLCIGASLAYITASKSHNLTEEALLTMTWVFIAMCFSQHPVYATGAQYASVTSVSGLRLAPTPALLLTRLADNVFAFISYYVICTFIFPVDPIRVLWNTRTKCYMSMNDLAQTIVSLGCAPITQEGKETDFLIAKARSLVKAQQSLLKSYAEWMPKCETEPTIRGGDYPVAACARLRFGINEVMSLEEALVAAMERLHRPREQPPGVVLRDMMEMTRPFLLDAGKLIHHFFQCMIDATEKWRTWSMEEPLHTIWKMDLACRSLHHVTGNIQRNFYAAVQQVDGPEKQALNMYVSSTMVEEALSKGKDPAALRDANNEDLLKRVLQMNLHISKETTISRDDIQAFNATVIVFELLLKSMGELLQPMIQVYEFEKSRHV